jgi:hypothetical protein
MLRRAPALGPETVRERADPRPAAQKAKIMSIHPRNDGRAVARTRYRILSSRSPATPAAVAVSSGRARTGHAGTSEAPHLPGGSPGVPAQDSGARGRRSDAVVGHRLAEGQMSVHTPGQPCGLCASSGASSGTPGRHRRPKAGKGRVRLAIQSVRWAAAVSAVTIAMTAVIASAGGGASALAATPTAPANGVTWHKLTLINGWSSHVEISGAPSWAVKGGVVYLSGSLFQASGTDVNFTILPRAARPARALILPVYTYGDTNGWLEIYPNGYVYANSNPYSEAQSYTSLAGVSFRGAGTATHKLTLRNGWKFDGGFWNSKPSYAISSGVVYLSGSMHQTSGSSDIFAILPKAARPAHDEYITVSTSGGVPGVLLIYPDGVMAAYSGNARSLTFLGGVSYPQATLARHKLALRDGWISGQSHYGTGDPSYSVTGGVVHLSGSLIQPGGGDAFAHLPRGTRPAHDLYIKVYTYNGSVGTLFIQPDGLMQAYSRGSDATSYTSLAAISFPVKS